MAIEIKSDYLDQLQIATPCRANWQRMEKVDGKENVRFCGSCQKNVYKLSLMSREEAMALLREKNGEVCARLSRRADGTVIFGDCPVGQSQIRQKRRGIAVFMALLMAFVPSPVSHALKRGTAGVLRKMPFISDFQDAAPVRNLTTWLDDSEETEIMGDIAPIRSTAPTNPPASPANQ